MKQRLAEERAERIRNEVANNLELKLNNKTLKVTVSIGVSMFPLNGQDHTGLIDAADKALYQAKANGRNQSVVAGQYN